MERTIGPSEAQARADMGDDQYNSSTPGEREGDTDLDHRQRGGCKRLASIIA